MTETEGPYPDNLHHLQDELGWLDLVLRLGVLRARSSRARFGGLCVSEEAVEEMLNEPPVEHAESPEEIALIEQRREEIARRVAASVEKGVSLRLPRLAELFALAPFEVDVLLVCLAPELDLKYERLYAYLQDDVTRRSPSVDLVFHLLCRSAEDRILARGAFLPSGRLFRYSLLRFVEAGDPARSLLARPLKLDEGAAQYLLGGREIDQRLAFCARLIVPKEGTLQEAQASELHARLLAAFRRYLGQPSSQQWLAIFHGPDRAGQEEMARALCSEVGLSALRVDLEALSEGDIPFEQGIRLVFREAALRSAAIYLDQSDSLLREGEKGPSRCRGLEAAMLDMGWITFLAGTRPWEPPHALKQHLYFSTEFPIPSYPERRRLWEAAFDGNHPLTADLDLAEVAARFRFTRGEIKNAVSTARNLALLRDGPSYTLTPADLQAACRAESNPRLLSFARKIQTQYTWEELVLPQEQRTQLREIVEYIRHHEAVYTEWGFGQKHAMGKGINILFSGPSGTGKTMAAGIMAAELGLDLYKIDLSTVVSKYIGETEKNLSRVFKEAETSNAILFFDEADALFGKRSEVKDSHDRYANIEVNYLLQKMEEHEGIVILATNFSKNVDEAFLRRLHFAMLFPFPEKEERLRIWRQVFPGEAPLGEDVNFEFLARRLKIAGGSIKNIALGAAFLAQSEKSPIGMPQIVLAAKREFQKMGKICVKADFGEYYELVI